MSFPREGSRVTEEGYLVCSLPDWCRIGNAVYPFQIYAKQIHEVNSCATVRLTSKRAYNKKSIIRCCTGDEGGVDLGVTSNTKESLCWPKTWSKTVFFEGANAVRHDDQWWMNNGNTWGKLFYIKDQNPRDLTPRVQLASIGTLFSSSGIGTFFGQFGARPPVTVTPRPMPGVAPRPTAPVEPPTSNLPTTQGPGSGTPPQTSVPQVPQPEGPGGGPTQTFPRAGQPHIEHHDIPDVRKDPNPNSNKTQNPDNHRTSGECKQLTICFKPRDETLKKKGGYTTQSKYEKEYKRQLALQQGKLNSKTARKCYDDKEAYDRKSPQEKADMRKQAENEQAKERRNFEKKFGEDALNDRELFGDGAAALHVLDMVAGGTFNELAGMGNSKINSSIGSSWTKWGRQDELKNYCKEMRDKGCPVDIRLIYGCLPTIDPRNHV